MGYKDIHTHLLPEMDDGARNVDDSLKLIKGLKENNVDFFAFTPHYYSDKEPIENFVIRRQQSLDKIRDILPKDIKYVLSSETFVTDYLFNEDDISALCYEDTNYLLTEFGYDITFEKALDRIERLISKYDVIPIIAHIERYPNILKPSYVARLIERGALIQVNIDFFKRLLPKIKAGKLVKLGLVHFIASDSHSEESRHIDFNEWSAKFKKLYGDRAFNRAMRNAGKLFKEIN